MRVTLTRYSFDPDALCGEAAAICTGSEEPIASLRGAMASGHESVAEHAAFTFRIEGVSRVLLAQLTRHRMASYSVQSQRYCGVNPEWVVPVSILNSGWCDTYRRELDRCFTAYQGMVADGVPEEDARYIIPQAVTCNLYLTMNGRELRHFFELRCCNRAQWEIRHLADEMHRLCKEVAPVLFRKSGAACQQGKKCPEGRLSCGKPRGGVKVGKQSETQGAGQA